MKTVFEKQHPARGVCGGHVEGDGGERQPFERMHNGPYRHKTYSVSLVVMKRNLKPQ